MAAHVRLARRGAASPRVRLLRATRPASRYCRDRARRRLKATHSFVPSVVCMSASAARIPRRVSPGGGAFSAIQTKVDVGGDSGQTKIKPPDTFYSITTDFRFLFGDSTVFFAAIATSFCRLRSNTVHSASKSEVFFDAVRRETARHNLTAFVCTDNLVGVSQKKNSPPLTVPVLMLA